MKTYDQLHLAEDFYIESMLITSKQMHPYAYTSLLVVMFVFPCSPEMALRSSGACHPAELFPEKLEVAKVLAWE